MAIAPTKFPVGTQLGVWIVVKYLGIRAPQNNSGTAEHLHLCSCRFCGYENELLERSLIRLLYDGRDRGKKQCKMCKTRQPVTLDGITKPRGEWVTYLAEQHSLALDTARRKLRLMEKIGTTDIVAYEIEHGPISEKEKRNPHTLDSLWKEALCKPWTNLWR